MKNLDWVFDWLTEDGEYDPEYDSGWIEDAEEMVKKNNTPVATLPFEGGAITEEVKQALIGEGMKLNGAIAFCLAMLDEETKVVNIYTRDVQPCYGELRKYLKSHGNEYTDPEPHDDYRPTDLFSPFPEGTPVGLAVFTPWNKKKEWAIGFGSNRKVFPTKSGMEEDYLSFVFSKDSPWANGMPESGVDIARDADGHPRLLVFNDLDVDPTVLVNALNMVVRHLASPWEVTGINLLHDAGATMMELCILKNIFNVHVQGKVVDGELKTNFISTNSQVRGYYSALFPDVSRMVNKDARDLTGGTLKNRFDYNRKRLHEIFEVNDTAEDVQKMATENSYVPFFKHLSSPSTTAEQIVSKLREVYAEELGLETKAAA